MLRWAASAPSGAAIMKIRSAGPSRAPKSTPSGLDAKARLGRVTWAERRADADPALQAGGQLVPLVR
jgi:hypothetical protein